MCSDIHNSLVYDVVDLHIVPTVMEKHGKNLVMEMGKKMEIEHMCGALGIPVGCR